MPGKSAEIACQLGFLFYTNLELRSCCEAAYLIIAVGASLCEEGLRFGVPQQVILGCPLHNLDIVPYRQ